MEARGVGPGCKEQMEGPMGGAAGGRASRGRGGWEGERCGRVGSKAPLYLRVGPVTADTGRRENVRMKLEHSSPEWKEVDVEFERKQPQSVGTEGKWKRTTGV